MVNKYVFAVVVLGAMFMNPAFSHSAQPVSLSALLTEALENNPQIQAARQRYEAGKARAALFRQVPDPRVEYEYNRISPAPSVGSKLRPMKTFAVSQEIPFPTKIFLRRKASQREAQALEQEYKQTEQTVKKEVKEAYSRLFLNRRKVMFVKDSLSLLKQFVETTNSKYAANRAGQQDVLRAQVEYSKLSNTALLYEQEAKIAESLLKSLLGRGDNFPLEIADTDAAADLPLTEEEAVALAKKHRPELRSFREMLGKAEAERTLSKQGFFPDMTLRYERAAKDGKLSGLSEGEWAGMIGFTVPLWFGGKQAAEVREAQANFRAARAEYTAVENVTVFEVRSAYAQYATARNMVAIYETGILPQATAAVTAARRAYEAGQTSFPELLDTVRMLRDLQMEYFESVAAVQISLADLLQCCGIELEDIRKERL